MKRKMEPIMQQIARITKDYGHMTITHISIELEKTVDRATRPGTFRGMYYRWFAKHINATSSIAKQKVPQMIKRLRETQDMTEFGMIIRFLSDHEPSDETLASILEGNNTNG
jgi:hypothetical protein